MNGFIHSFQSLGAVDGPGLRCVVFMQGCPLRCIYCHNPDTWLSGGTETSVEQLSSRIRRFSPYFGEKGGVTVSGGEPLLQWEFVAELFRQLHEEGISTALDTSGIGDPKGALEVLNHCDTVLCDIKFSSDELYKKYCGGSLDTVLNFLSCTEKLSVPLWVRHVVVPGLTDGDIPDIVDMAVSFNNLQKIELLPFRKLCMEKYEKLNIPFPLADTPEASGELIAQLYEQVPNRYK